MIKRYLDFIKENIEFNSIGEWVESLIDDDYIKNIVSRYTNESDASIKLSNAINILDDRVKSEIKKQIDDYLSNGIQEKNPDIIASTDLEELKESEITMAGKGIFSSFLKSLTSLGQKEVKPNLELCPDTFLLYYFYPNLNSDDVKQVFSRFKSLSRYLDLVDYQKNEVNLYFGVKIDGNFEYGLNYDGKLVIIGQFKLSQSVIKWICQIESRSAHSLKKELVNFSYLDIIILGKIKTDMASFNPGFHEKRMTPSITDKVISFGYYGLGNWSNGKIQDSELLTIKNNFMNWIVSKKWGNKVLISIKQSSFWVYLHIKLK